MAMPSLPARRRAARPVVEGLESRELLSTLRHSNTHAEVSALRVTPRHRVPTITQLPTAPTQTVSTVPANGDVNPYGVAFVPAGFPRDGVLNPGDVLVSNFNNSQNLQGTGSTIVRVTPSGRQSVFFQGPQGVGLSTALGVLREGYVLVGNLPSTDGTSATARQGSLLLLDRSGNVVANFTDPKLLNGPWDLTINDRGNRAQVFVSNVLSGTVSRFDARFGPNGQVRSIVGTQIALGYTHHGDPAAFELGPTGLAFDPRNNTLYVASTADNTVYAIPRAGTTRVDNGTGFVAFQDNTHLHGPLGLAFAPDGNLIVANGDAINPDPNNTSTLVEFTRQGRFVGQFSLNPGPGGAFGLAVSPHPFPMLAAVNDVTNSLQTWLVRR